MLARDLMTVSPVTASVTNTLREIRDWMFSSHIRHVPILHEGVLVGFLSDRDLHNDGRFRPEELDEPVSDIMRSQTITVFPEDSLRSVMEVMLQHKLSAVPVVQRDGQRLLGVISYLDIFRSLLQSGQLGS